MADLTVKYTIGDLFSLKRTDVEVTKIMKIMNNNIVHVVHLVKFPLSFYSSKYTAEREDNAKSL